MALLYDDYDEHSVLHQNRWIEYCKSLLGINKKTIRKNFELFEYAGAAWGGYENGTVDPNPMCVTCGTQLSFTDKDMLICDHCHKTKQKDGEFQFTENLNVLSYQTAYLDAQNKWVRLLDKKLENKPK